MLDKVFSLSIVISLGSTMESIGILLIILGITLVIIAAIIFFIIGVRASGQVKGGGVILIGPIPIIIGSDKEVIKWAILLTIASMLFILAMYILAR